MTILNSVESLKLFNGLDPRTQLAIMMAHGRLSKVMACPIEWSLGNKIGVADLCMGVKR
jgi:hypothetical protein